MGCGNSKLTTKNDGPFASSIIKKCDSPISKKAAGGKSPKRKIFLKRSSKSEMLNNDFFLQMIKIEVDRSDFDSEKKVSQNFC